jgi:hypothetical protein
MEVDIRHVASIDFEFVQKGIDIHAAHATGGASLSVVVSLQAKRVRLRAKCELVSKGEPLCDRFVSQVASQVKRQPSPSLPRGIHEFNSLIALGLRTVDKRGRFVVT